MEGWIKLYREVLDKPIWKLSTKEQKVVLLTLLLMANHKANKWEWNGKKFECAPGQFVTSLDEIVKNSGKDITVQNVRTAIKRFEKLDFLTNESTKTGRLITIVNWRVYQSSEDEPNKDINIELTDSQQSPNNELTPNKNDKNVKNEKKVNNIVRFTPPDIDMVREYCMERNNNVEPQSFIDFYSSKGWMIGKNKMKDWKAAVRTWERNNNKQATQTGKPDKVSEVDTW